MIMARQLAAHLALFQQPAESISTGTVSLQCRGHRDGPPHQADDSIRNVSSLVFKSSDIFASLESLAYSPSYLDCDSPVSSVSSPVRTRTRPLELRINLSNGHILSPTATTSKEAQQPGMCNVARDFWHSPNSASFSRNDVMIPTDVGDSDEECEDDEASALVALDGAYSSRRHATVEQAVSVGIGESPNHQLSQVYLKNSDRREMRHFSSDNASSASAYRGKSDMRSPSILDLRSSPADFPETPVTESESQQVKISLLSRDAAALLKVLQVDSPPLTSQDSSGVTSPSSSAHRLSAKLHGLRQYESSELQGDRRDLMERSSASIQLGGARGGYPFVASVNGDVQRNSVAPQCDVDPWGVLGTNAPQESSTLKKSSNNSSPRLGDSSRGTGAPSALRERRLRSHRRSSFNGSGPPSDLPAINTNLHMPSKAPSRLQRSVHRDTPSLCTVAQESATTSWRKSGQREFIARAAPHWHAKVRAWKAYAEAVEFEGCHSSSMAEENSAPITSKTSLEGPGPSRNSTRSGEKQRSLSGKATGRQFYNSRPTLTHTTEMERESLAYESHFTTPKRLEGTRLHDVVEDLADSPLDGEYAQTPSVSGSLKSSDTGQSLTNLQDFDFAGARSFSSRSSSCFSNIPTRTSDEAIYKGSICEWQSGLTGRRRPSTSSACGEAAASLGHRSDLAFGLERTFLSRGASPGEPRSRQRQRTSDGVVPCVPRDVGDDEHSVRFSNNSNALEEDSIELSEEREVEQHTSLFGTRRRLVSAFPDLGTSVLRSALQLRSLKSNNGSRVVDAAEWTRKASERSISKAEEEFEAREAELTVEAISKQEEVSVEISVYTEERTGRWTTRGLAARDAPVAERLPEVVDVWQIPIDSRSIIARKKLRSNIELASTRTVVGCAACSYARTRGIAVHCHLCKGHGRVEKVYVVTVTLRIASFLPLKLPSVHLLGTMLPGVKYVEGQDDSTREEILRQRALEGTIRAAQRVTQGHAARHAARPLMAKAHIKRRGLMTVSAHAGRSGKKRIFNVFDGEGKITEIKKQTVPFPRSLESSLSLESLEYLSGGESGSGSLRSHHTHSKAGSTLSLAKSPRPKNGHGLLGVPRSSSLQLGEPSVGGPEAAASPANAAATTGWNFVREERSGSVTPKPTRLLLDHSLRRSTTPVRFGDGGAQRHVGKSTDGEAVSADRARAHAKRSGVGTSESFRRLFRR